ncbi:MAG: TetR/AcrR family transcriptional regulator [Sciscionella sp.]
MSHAKASREASASNQRSGTGGEPARPVGATQAPEHAEPRRSARSEQLLLAASRRFAAKGYDATSMNEIAATVGISGAALYRHFRGKQDLLTQVLLAELDRLTETVTQTMRANADEPAEVRLHALATAIAAVAVQRRAVTAVWRWEGTALQRSNHALVLARGSELIERWAATLLNCRAELSLDAARVLCWAAMSVFGSVADHRVRLARREFVPALAEVALAVLRTELPAADETSRGQAPGARPSTRRLQILTEATRLFAERGYRAVSMEDIGAAAGIAAPSVYRHYGSKDAILLVAARSMGDRLTVDAARVLGREAGPTRALVGLLHSYTRTLSEFRDLVTVYRREVGNLPAARRAELIGIQRDYVAQWVELVLAARPDLDVARAKIVVHAALAIANDLSATSASARLPIPEAHLLAMAGSALGLPQGRGDLPPQV